MSLFQLKIDPILKKAIETKADEYGVPASSLARIALVNAFLKYDRCPPPTRTAPSKEMTLDQFVAMAGGRYLMRSMRRRRTISRMQSAKNFERKNSPRLKSS